MHGKKFLYTEIYEQLRAQIERGELLPEDRLPSEEALAEAHSVSRITVKKALERLREDGLIQRVQGRGTFVSRAMPGERRQGAAPARRLIGIVLEHVSSAFGLNMMYYMIQALDKAGYKACIRFTFGSTERESAEIDDLLSMGVAGLIIMPCHDSHYNLTILRLILEDFPVVLVDKRMHGLPVCSVSTDGREAMRRLTHHLCERGCKSAALLTIDPASTSSLGDRAEGFYKGLEETGMARAGECILPRRTSEMISNAPRRLLRRGHRRLPRRLAGNPGRLRLHRIRHRPRALRRLRGARPAARKGISRLLHRRKRARHARRVLHAYASGRAKPRPENRGDSAEADGRRGGRAQGQPRAGDLPSGTDNIKYIF